MNPTAALLQPEVRELVQEGRYAELREVLHQLPFADVADILGELEPSEAAVAFRFLLRDDAAEVFSYLDPEKQEELIQKLGDEGALRIVEAMSADDRVRLLDELPPAVAQRLVASFSPQTRRETQAILGYPQGTVGRLMTPDYVHVRPEWTCAKVLEHIRKYGKDAETINVLYAIDRDGKLVDDIRLRQVLLAEPEALVESLMNYTYVSLRADQAQQEAVNLMSKYDRTVLPVVDSRGVLVGVVTVDDVIDVAQEEATEDMQKIGGTGALEMPYMEATVGDLVRKRAPWLMLLFLSELLTSNAITAFESEIERVAVLAAFIPGIISSGGNSGSQASTLVIRAMALGQVTMKDWARILRRELLCGLVLGAILGLIGLFRVNLWGWLGWWKRYEVDPSTGERIADMSVQNHYMVLSAAISCSLVFVVLWGSIMGAMLPIVLKRIRLDPATSSTPFVATLVDVTGILIYFTCAIVILSGTLL